ncbi:hypothetical protein TCAL_07539 [Tigriopus californicus]|uniref:Endothelin-converting enzyme 1 n=1 Tax=Tigriopus californicus TaxID=6832 RepID=A0A553PNY9_TIGCA|nr:hypothetical protein TCAL_07539 [Tigriopus californicus]
MVVTAGASNSANEELRGGTRGVFNNRKVLNGQITPGQIMLNPMGTETGSGDQDQITQKAIKERLSAPVNDTDIGHPLLPLTTRPQTSKNASLVDCNTMENGLTTTSSSNHKKKWKEHPENERDAGSTKCCCGLARFRGLTSLEKCLCLALASCLAILVIFILLTCVGFLRSNGSDTIHHSLYSSNSYIQTKASYLLGAMDRTADPCEDFFQFACGTWNRKHVIPEDRSSISTFEVLADQQQIILKGILEEVPNDLDNEATTKAKYFYQSCMDMGAISDVGDAPLRRVIEELGGWPVTDPNWSEDDTLPLEKMLGILKRNFTLGVLIEEWIGPDDRNSKQHIIQIDQMQLGLPSRDYFLHLDSYRDLAAYHQYMTDVAILMGANETIAHDQLWKVVEFEQLLANISIPEEDRLDTGSIYRQLSLNELATEVPSLDWNMYFQEVLTDLPFNGSEKVVCYSMPYFKDLGDLLRETETNIIHNYVIWRLVMDLMPHMPPEYEDTRAEFRRVLLGVLTDRNRWNRCVEWTNKKLGMAVGALFIRDNFNHDSKVTALEMIHDIREAFNELLEENEWMDKETRAVAKDKANGMNERIGYPEYITNTTRLEEEYQDLEISQGMFLQDLFNILAFEGSRIVEKLRQPVDKDKWATEPAVVNAFYNPNKNDIAGILQPLFYSQHFPKSLNYGGIGVVIGHEITHGFDDKGRQFDKHGNLKQWWNNRTIAEFRTAAQCIIDQYTDYQLEDVNLNINGKMTQGENIADNGGLKQAFRAYKKWVAEHGEEALLPGLNMTHDQLFFLNYAQIWCGSMRPEDAVTKIRSSVHSPGPIRVLGPLSNSWDFAEAFQCPAGSRMNPVEKCSVW